MVEKTIGMKQPLEGKTELHWQTKQSIPSHPSKSPKQPTTKTAETSTDCEGQGLGGVCVWGRLRFRQGWAIDSRHMSPEKALGRSRGWPGLHPPKGASAALLASGCRGSCQGPPLAPWDQKVSLLLHTQSDPPLSALLGLPHLLPRRTQLGRGCPGGWRAQSSGQKGPQEE